MPVFNEQRYTMKSPRMGGVDALYVDPVSIPVNYDYVYVTDVQYLGHTIHGHQHRLAGQFDCPGRDGGPGIDDPIPPQGQRGGPFRPVLDCRTWARSTFRR